MSVYLRDDNQPTGYYVAWVIRLKWYGRFWYWITKRDPPKHPIFNGSFGVPTIEIDHYIEYWSIPE